MKAISFAAACCFSLSTVMAQETNVLTAVATNNMPRTNGLPAGTMTTIGAYDLRYEGTKGSKYFIDEWLSGELVFVKENTKAPKTVPLKYDSQSKELLYKRSVGDSIIVNPSQITGFVIHDARNNASFPFVKFEGLKTEGGTVPVAYMMVLYKNKTSLLKYVSKMMNKANYSALSNVDRRYDEYTDNSEYFIQKPDGSLSKAKLKKNAILKALNDKEDQLEAYIKKENLTFKDEYDLARVVAYYNTL
ncbi:hypothetical protein [Emticicia agri]|uniref:Uncharacterized protein n=1 Tax=Emticicia agri TaxID=2492393 RepID=A0A4Q5M162_9BACT|nr:hypothetical protein [Emticicia agri]RYU95922.1 hypothetical protein EWM59_09900 [Emticicia agri]